MSAKSRATDVRALASIVVHNPVGSALHDHGLDLLQARFAAKLTWADAAILLLAQHRPAFVESIAGERLSPVYQRKRARRAPRARRGWKVPAGVSIGPEHKLDAEDRPAPGKCAGCRSASPNLAGAYCPTCRQRGAAFGWCPCGAAVYRDRTCRNHKPERVLLGHRRTQ